jgi:Flp pilus assembly protein TadD
LLQVAAVGDPTFMKAHLELGKCYLEMGRLQEAVQALSRAAELAPHSWEPHGLLAEAYTRLNDEEKRKAELAIIEKLRRERDQSVQDAMEKVVHGDTYP